MITDLHCHYPMHLVHSELEPKGVFADWLTGEIEQEAFDVAGHLVNAPHPWGDTWRVDRAGLERAGVATVCSVLYWPVDELIPGAGPHPEPGSFAHLLEQMDAVEADVGAGAFVRPGRPVDGMRFVHCVEGGFHLGPDDVAANVGTLARRGVFYITLAHLLFRGVATNAPAIPLFTDWEYRLLFRQDRRVGLTEIGQEALAAMVEHRVAVDVSHMSTRAVRHTFDLLEDLDPGRTLPVLATHVAAREEGPGDQEYNLGADVMRAVAERNGLVGLILAEHQLGHSHGNEDRSRALVKRHLGAMIDAAGPEHVALGTDLDGFINPTLAGLTRAEDLGKLAAWIEADFPTDAAAILHANADRVIDDLFGL